MVMAMAEPARPCECMCENDNGDGGLMGMHFDTETSHGDATDGDCGFFKAYVRPWMHSLVGLAVAPHTGSLSLQGFLHRLAVGGYSRCTVV